MSRMKGHRNEAPCMSHSHAPPLLHEKLQASLRMNPSRKWPLSVMMIGGTQGLRASLRAMVRQEPGFCLAGEAETGAAALELAFLWQPAVALVDVCLPDRSGFEVMQCFKQAAPGCVVILLSDGPDPCVDEVSQMLGATEVCLKASDLNRIPDILRRLVEARAAVPAR
jgi:two-component system, NarL family, response regulator LiaR